MINFNRWIDRLNKSLVFVIGILLIVMVLTITFQIMVRMIFPKLGIQFSAPWAGELPLYCMIWMIFLGAAVATRNNKLISVDILQVNLPPKGRKIVNFIAMSLSIVFFVGLLVAGYHWAMFGMTETSTSMGISMFYVYVSLPVSALVMILNSVAYLFDEFSIKESIKVDELTQNADFSV